LPPSFSAARTTTRRSCTATFIPHCLAKATLESGMNWKCGATYGFASQPR
jgi:hypothetical protein